MGAPGVRPSTGDGRHGGRLEAAAGRSAQTGRWGGASRRGMVVVLVRDGHGGRLVVQETGAKAKGLGVAQAREADRGPVRQTTDFRLHVGWM